LGALFYAMVTCLPPVRLRSATWRDYIAALDRIRHLPEEPLKKTLKKVPRGLDDVLRAAMAPKADNRYSTIAEFVTEFCEVLLQSPLTNPSGKPDNSLAAALSRILLGK
jgi:serine/threonine protein kinase